MTLFMNLITYLIKVFIKFKLCIVLYMFQYKSLAFPVHAKIIFSVDQLIINTCDMALAFCW